MPPALLTRMSSQPGPLFDFGDGTARFVFLPSRVRLEQESLATGGLDGGHDGFSLLTAAEAVRLPPEPPGGAQRYGCTTVMPMPAPVTNATRPDRSMLYAMLMSPGW